MIISFDAFKTAAPTLTRIDINTTMWCTDSTLDAAGDQITLDQSAPLLTFKISLGTTATSVSFNLYQLNGAYQLRATDEFIEVPLSLRTDTANYAAIDAELAAIKTLMYSLL